MNIGGKNGILWICSERFMQQQALLHKFLIYFILFRWHMFHMISYWLFNKSECILSTRFQIKKRETDTKLSKRMHKKHYRKDSENISVLFGNVAKEQKRLRQGGDKSTKIYILKRNPLLYIAGCFVTPSLRTSPPSTFCFFFHFFLLSSFTFPLACEFFHPRNW